MSLAGAWGHRQVRCAVPRHGSSWTRPCVIRPRSQTTNTRPPPPPPRRTHLEKWESRKAFEIDHLPRRSCLAAEAEGACYHDGAVVLRLGSDSLKSIHWHGGRGPPTAKWRRAGRAAYPGHTSPAQQGGVLQAARTSRMCIPSQNGPGTVRACRCRRWLVQSARNAEGALSGWGTNRSRNLRRSRVGTRRYRVVHRAPPGTNGRPGQDGLTRRVFTDLPGSKTTKTDEHV